MADPPRLRHAQCVAFAMRADDPPGDKKKGKGGGSSSASKEKRINPEAMAIVAPFLKAPASGPIGEKEMVERMVFRFMKECMHSLEDGVIKSAADGGASCARVHLKSCSRCYPLSFTRAPLQTLGLSLVWASRRFSVAHSAMPTRTGPRSLRMTWRATLLAWARSSTRPRSFLTMRKQARRSFRCYEKCNGYLAVTQSALVVHQGSKLPQAVRTNSA